MSETTNISDYLTKKGSHDIVSRVEGMEFHDLQHLILDVGMDYCKGYTIAEALWKSKEFWTSYISAWSLCDFFILGHLNNSNIKTITMDAYVKLQRNCQKDWKIEDNNPTLFTTLLVSNEEL